MQKRQQFRLFAVAIFLILGFCASAQEKKYAVVVSSQNQQDLTSQDVVKIFLVKTRSFPNGDAAQPVINRSSSAIENAFMRRVLKKRARQLRAYYSRLMFTGRGGPPKALKSDQEILDRIKIQPDTIGVIHLSAVTDAVRVVLRF